jgi:hypothetical protein
LNQMSFCVLALLICMPNVGTWKMFWECATRCLPVMWSLGWPCLSAIHIKWMCEKGMLEIDNVFFLWACSLLGLVNENMNAFDSMRTIFGISLVVDHYYTCMLDFVGHTSCLNETESVIKKISCKLNVAMWWPCLVLKEFMVNLNMENILQNVFFELKPKMTTSYELLSNIYAKNWRNHAYTCY